MARTAAKPAPKERRKYPRLPLSIPVFVRGTGEDGREFLEFATALNVSAGGILLATRRVRAAMTVSLEIPIAPLPTANGIPPSIRSLKARTVRVRHGDRFQIVGLKFLRSLYK